MGAVLSYCTPAMQAAIELGAEEFWDVMDGGMTPAPLIALFEQTRRPLAPMERDRLTMGIRRSFLGATIDPRVSYEELLSDVWRQLDGVNLASEDSGDGSPVPARGIVRLTLRPAQCRDEHSPAPLPSASLSARNHQPCRLALPQILHELPGC